MDKLTKKKIKYLVYKINIVGKRIKNILKECAMSNDETISFWSGKEKELKNEYLVLKTIYGIVIRYVIEKEYWYKTKEQAERINKLKSINITVDSDYKKKLIHTRTIKNLANNAYNSFATALDTGYKKKIRLLSDIQQTIIAVNRLVNDTE